MKIINAFSAGMLEPGKTAYARFSPLTELQAAQIAAGIHAAGQLESAVGHQDTAAVFSTSLGVEIPFARITVKLGNGETCLLGQLSGPRLPEGATTLPEGASLEWMLVAVGYED
jgi:hypothetical protein